ncbi:nucleotidyltransferase [Candidatus Woesearchaeota archaeon]|nr:nucleotidyltransferase [Candidatus Woesearchaeota archaeon]
MISEKFKQALSIIAYTLGNSQIPFVVIGSTNKLLQGMNVEPKDIDIDVHVDNLKKIEHIFKERLVQGFEQYKTKTKEPAWHVVVKINEVEVEFVGEKETGIYWKSFLANEYTTIKVDDLEVLCLTLEAEMEADEAKGRFEKVAQVREFLKKRT